MIRFVALLELACLSVGVTAACGADQPRPRNYVIHVEWNENTCADECPPESGKVLAAPTVAVVENREATYLVGGETEFDGEQIPHGTSLKVRVVPGDGKQAVIKGMVESSNIGPSSKDLVVRRSVAAHFKQTVVLGKKTRLTLPKTADGEQWIDLTVDEVGEFDAAVRPSDKKQSVPKR